jgi:hypothetical protein
MRGSAKQAARSASSSDEDQQFHVDDKVGNKRMREWLSMNMDRFDYMCGDLLMSPPRLGTCQLLRAFRLSLYWTEYSRAYCLLL